MSNNVLVTFDVDGTILLSVPGTRQHVDAIKKSALDLYGIPLSVDIKEYCNSNFSGTTDSWIAKVIIEKSTGKEATQEQIDEFTKSEVDNFHNYFEGDHYALVGVQDALKKISEMDNVTMALCTGNFEKIGWTKVRHAGVEQYFKHHVGGFGEINERKNILRKAIENAEKAVGHKFDRIIHIGDAVQDVEAAMSVGIIPLGIETGRLKKADFPKPCFVIPNMKDGFDDFVSIIQTGKPIHKECENF